MATPSLKFANTFRIAARHGSFRRAAEELCITASAVSNQIRVLEEQLGILLFDRGPHSLRLTEAGRYYFANVEALFERLEAITEQLRTRFKKRLVRLAAPPFFSTELLLPRLGDLSKALSGADIQLSTAIAPHAVHAPDVDVSVIVGAGDWPELKVDQLFAQQFVAAAAPQLLHDQPVMSAREIAGRALLVHSRRPDLWDRWATVNGIARLQPKQLIKLDSMTAIVSAAEQGVGFALVSQPLARRRFAAGTLVRLADAHLTTGEAYYLVTRPADAEQDIVQALFAWMRSKYGVPRPAPESTAQVR